MKERLWHEGRRVAHGRKRAEETQGPWRDEHVGRARGAGSSWKESQQGAHGKTTMLVALRAQWM